MSYTPTYTGSFKKDFKRIGKRGYNMSLLKTIIDILLEKGELPTKYYPHPLIGNYKGCFECHIKPDWLLIWTIDEVEKIITLHRTGTHSDLFK